MSNMLDDTMSTAKNAIGTAKVGTEHAVASTRSMLLDGLHAATSLVTLLRSLDRDDALGWVGLARRTGPMRSLGLFGAGLAVGAGAGMLFAPMSGAEARRTLLNRLLGAKDAAVETVGAKIEDAGEKVHDLADKAGDAVKKAEHQVASKATAGAHAVMNKIDAATSAVKHAADDAKPAKAADPNGRTHHLA